VAPGTASAFSQGPFDGARRSKEDVIGSCEVFLILILFMLILISLIFHLAGALVQRGFIAATKVAFGIFKNLLAVMLSMTLLIGAKWLG
jgi:hypothetical protein